MRTPPREQQSSAEELRHAGLTSREIKEIMHVRTLADDVVLGAARNEGGWEQQEIENQIRAYNPILITRLCALEALARGLMTWAEAERILDGERFSYNALALNDKGRSIPEAGCSDMDVYADFTVVGDDHEEALRRVREWARRQMVADPRIDRVSVSRHKRLVSSAGPWQPDGRYYDSITRASLGLDVREG